MAVIVVRTTTDQFWPQGAPLTKAGAPSARLVAIVKAGYNPQQRRDSHGRWMGIRLTGKEISEEVDPAKLAALAYAYGMAHFRDKIVKNVATGWDISIPKRGLKKAANSHHFQLEKLQAIAAIPDMIAHARYSHSEPDRRQREDVAAIHHLHVPLKIALKPYRAHLVVVEAKTGRHYYDHNLFHIRKLPLARS